MNRFLSLIILVLVLVSAQVQAQWSYIYIQGDKQLPFYVKLEGEMLPRYGKNYCIIPRLSQGEVHIQVLFQQNQFPPQNYTINVPADGYRGFLLSKNDGKYALYDIDQQGYLLPGAKDQLSAAAPPPVAAASAPPPKPATTKEMPQSSRETPSPVQVKDKPDTKPKSQPTSKKSGDPQFIDDIVLGKDTATTKDGAITLREKARKDTPATTVVVTDTAKDEIELDPEIVLESGETPILNSDCMLAMSKIEFNEIYKAAVNTGKGDKLIPYLLKKIPGNCYTTRQVFELADLMDEEALIFLYLKKVYPRITDQQNFPLLGQYLFETEKWSKAFRTIHQ